MERKEPSREFAQIIKSDFIPNVLEKALPVIDEDRARYKPIWEIVLEYCKANSIIISDRLTLFKVKKTREQYNLYCANPFKHAVHIANQIHQVLGEKLLFVKTVKEHEELSIEIDTRTLINVFAIERYRKIDAIKLINPVNINGLLYMPPEIEIIEVLNSLYDVAKFGDWKTLLENDFPQLYDKVMVRKAEGVLGAAECKRARKEYVDLLKLDILQKWLPSREDVILVGTWAYHIVAHGLHGRDGLCGDVEKVQIISHVEPAELLEDLRAFLNIPHKITVRENELHIPKDFRTKRSTFYLSIDGKDKPVIDLFNSSSFELIPFYSKNKLLIADNYVIMRFLFIDLWIVRFIEKLGAIPKDLANKKINHILKLVEFFKDLPEEKFVSYIGIYHDYTIDKRIANNMAGGAGKRKYFPDRHFREKKSYWQV